MLGLLIRKRVLITLPILILIYFFMDRSVDKVQRIESSKVRVNHMIAHDISYKIDLYNQTLMKEKEIAKDSTEITKIEEAQQRLYKLKTQLKSHDNNAIADAKNALEKDFPDIGFKNHAPELGDRISKVNISLKANELELQRHEEQTNGSFHKFIVKLFGLSKTE